MKKTLKAVIAFTFILITGSCQKSTETDGELVYVFNTTNLAASLGTTGTASGLPVAALSNGSITWTTGSINVKKIEFSAKKDQVPFSVQYENLSLINILTPSTAGSVALPSGTYGDTEVGVSLVQSSTNVPLTLNGTYTEASGTKIPVVLQFNENFDYKLKGPQIVISSDKYNASVTLELNNLVKGLVQSDFGQTTRTSGSILINSTVNAALYAKLKANLSAVAKVSIVHQ